MDLRLFEDFITLAETRSFSRAAERRNSAQSAFSRRIQSLERWVGAALIDRRSTPLQLTLAGEAFREIAEDMLRGIRHGREEVLSIATQTTTAISFAVTHSLALNFFPHWIKEIERKSGPLSLRLLSQDGEKCREALSQGDCHFMICHFDNRMKADFKASRLKSLSLGRDKLIPVSAPTADRSPLVKVPGTRDCRTPYLSYAHGSFMGRSLDLFFQESDQPAYLQPCFETSLAEGVKAMVLEGHGVGWLPETLIRRELETGRLVRAGGQEWEIEFEVRAFRPLTRLPKAAERLWNLIIQDMPSVTNFF
jgi:LysR family transcriptional regulator, hypochlorite-specific transcription factor HypT